MSEAELILKKFFNQNKNDKIIIRRWTTEERNLFIKEWERNKYSILKKVNIVNSESNL